MAVDQEQTFLYDLDGQPRAVAHGAREAFERDNPGARRVRLFDVDGAPRAVPQDETERFRQENPSAQPVYLFDVSGKPKAVSQSGLDSYLVERREAAQRENDARAKELAKNRKPAPPPDRKPEENRGNAVGRAVSAAGDVLGRVPANLEALGDRIVAGPLLLAGRVADALNPDPLAGPVDVLTGQRGRFSPQEMGYEEDPYRQGLASRTADKARAWLARRDEARAPKTAAGRVADVPIGFAAQLGGYATPAGPMMMVGNAAQAGDRAYAEGASGAAALGRTALSLGAQAAAFGPKPIPVPGANAVGRVVEGAAARIGGRLAQTPEGAARAVRTAVTAGQVARGAVESGARMAAVTAAEGGDAKDVAIAAGVGGAVGGALRGLSTRPLARVAGEAAERMAHGGVDTPPPRMDPAGLAANRAEATARTPEGDAALARANAGLASPERAGIPAPAEPGAVPTVYGQRTIVPPYYGPTVSRPGEPIAPPAPYADKVPEPIPETKEEVVRRRKEALDALPLPQRLKKTGFSAYFDQFPERAGVLDAIGFENFAKLYRKYKGDFRNVTGDLVNTSEVGGIVGRDYSGADGVRRALEDAAQEYAGYREWKEQGAPTAEEEMQTGQEVAWNRAQNAEAEAEVRRRYELAHPEMTGEPRVTEEEIRAAQAAAEQGEVERIEAEAMQEPEPEPAPAPAPAAGSATPPREATIAEKAAAVPWDTRDFYSWTANAFHTPEEANEVFGKVIEEMAKREISYAQAAAEVTNYTRYKTDALADRITDLAKAGIQIHQLVEEARAKLPPKEPDTVRQGWNAELYRLSDAKAELDRHQPGRKEYKSYLRKYERQTEDILDRMAELSPALKDVLTARRALEQALDAAEKKKGADKEWRAINDLVERARHYQQKAINKGPGVTFEEIEEPGYPLPGRGKAAEREPFALDGGTPAEIDAEKARAAEAQKRAALEEAAAAPGRDLGTVSIQEGLPGIGGDGTLFTPPAGGWSGRRASAPVGRGPGLAHPEPVVPPGASSAASPGPGPAPAPSPAVGAEDPNAALKRRAAEAAIRYDAGDATKEELRALGGELEAASLYATRAAVMSKIGEYDGFVQGTERGARDYEAHYGVAPGAPGYGALAQVARELGKGRLPEVARRLARRNAVGLFTSADGDPDSGGVAIRTDRFGLLDAEQREAVRKAAEERGVEYHELLREAIQKAAAAGPTRAAQVLAHELGHWLDFLPEGTLKRGNILGHVAGLYKYLKRSVYGSAAEAEAHGGPSLTKEEVRARAVEMTAPRESFPPTNAGRIEWLKAVGRNEKQARADLIAERRMATRPELKRQMEDLVAWYGQSDGADPYYADSPRELLAESFSAWIWAPEVAAEKAPDFVRLLEGWAPANKAEAWKAVDKLRGRDSLARKAAAAAEGRDPFDPEFAAEFKARRSANTQAFVLARKFEETLRPKLTGRERRLVEKARALGRFEPIRGLADDAARSIGGAEGRETRDDVIGAINTFLRADSWVEVYQRRLQRVVAEAAKAGVSGDELDMFLTARRMAGELLGKDLERGAMNLPGPGAMTPGDTTRRGVNEETSAAAYLHWLEDTLPAEQWRALNRAADDIYRIRWEEPNSPGRLLEESGALAPEVLSQLRGNRDYVRFMPVHSIDEMRELSSGKTSVWSGVYRRSEGSHDEGVSGLLATALGDATIIRNAAANIARRDIGTFLARVYPQYVQPAERKFVANPNGRPGGHYEVKQRTDRQGGRATLVWSEGGNEVGIDVPSWIVKPLLARDPARPRLPENRVMRALAWLSQSTSQALTTYSYLFNIRNAGFRDWNTIRRVLPAPEGAGPLRRAVRNVIGRPIAAAQDVWGGGHGKARQQGLPDEALDRYANTLPPDVSTAYQLGSDILDGLVKAFGGEGGGGVRPELVTDALRRFGGQRFVDAYRAETERDGRVNRALRDFLRRAWGAYNRPLRWMQRVETNEKINVRERLEREQPSWSATQKDDWTIRNAGTPRPDDRPLFLDGIPYPSGILPFYTINAHGLWDQLGRTAKEDPVGQGLQFANHAFWRWVVRYSWPFLVAGGAVSKWLRDQAEPDEDDTPDDAAAKRRISEVADAVEDWGEMQRSVPQTTSRSDFVVPLGWINRDRKTAWGVRIPYDQSLRPVDTAFDWLLSELFYQTGATTYRQTPGKDAVADAVGGVAPSAGWIPRAVSILFGGVDVGDNFRTVDKEADDLIAAGASRARALADVLTGRLLGQYSLQGAAPRRPGDEKEGLEKLLEKPGMAVLRSVLWAGDGGRRELAARMRKDVERLQRLAQEGLRAQWEGKEPTPEQEEALDMLSNRGQTERDFERRADERSEVSADEWQLGRAGRERGDWLDERYRITPPRLTDEDRNR